MIAEPDLLPELVDEGLDYFDMSGDEGDKLYVRAIRQHIAAKNAEVEALRNLCGAAYQLAGVHDAPEVWLDALSAAASGHPFSTDGLLPYMPQAVCEAEARAERLAEALREATDDLERGIDARIVVAQLRAALATQPGGDQPPRGCVMEDRKPRPATAWGIYNLGHLMDVAHLRKDAIAKCERLVGEPWSKCRKYMEVHKVRVTPKGASHE